MTNFKRKPLWLRLKQRALNPWYIFRSWLYRRTHNHPGDLGG